MVFQMYSCKALFEGKSSVRTGVEIIDWPLEITVLIIVI
jgi:hypothetical protein